jgi:N-acetylglucosamine-6-phosphate deacetylase
MSCFYNLILKDSIVYAEGREMHNGYIRIKAGKIVDIGYVHELDMDDKAQVISLPEQYKMVPGFIDLHIHGTNGADTMDATKDSLNKIAASLPMEGTTSFLATTITQKTDIIEKALSHTGTYINETQLRGNAEILGIHLEGPFINPRKAGAQPIQHIIPPDILLFKKWLDLSKHTIQVVTLAPEQTNALELIEYLKQNGIIASIGHSDATYQDVHEAIQSGSSQITHLFNQMRGLYQREPGVVGAAYLRNELMVELICDGIHVVPEMVKLSYQQISAQRLILITDSMRAKFLAEGEYELGGQKVVVHNGQALLEDGTLAGSILKMVDAMKNMMAYTGCSLQEAIQMSSSNPAIQLGVYDRKGSLKEGKDADIVILDENHNVFMTFCKGELAYQKGSENNESDRSEGLSGNEHGFRKIYY